MPITVQYNPNFVAGGMIAHGAGRGRFLQDQSRFDYQRLDADRKFDLAEDQFGEQQRQFDENLGQRQSEYDRSLQNRVNEAQRQQNQYLQGLASREYLTNQQLNQRALESDQYGQLARERMGLQAGMQERALGADAARQQRGFEFQERSALRAIREREEQQQFALGLKESQAIDAAWGAGKLTPNEYEQAKGLWKSKYNNVQAFRNEFPSSLPPPDPDSIEAIREAELNYIVGIGGKDVSGEDLLAPSEVTGYLGENGKFDKAQLPLLLDQIKNKRAANAETRELDIRDNELRRDRSERLAKEAADAAEAIQAERKRDSEKQQIKAEEAEQNRVASETDFAKDSFTALTKYRQALNKHNQPVKGDLGFVKREGPPPTPVDYGVPAARDRFEALAFPMGTYFTYRGKLAKRVEGGNGIVEVVF